MKRWEKEAQQHPETVDEEQVAEVVAMESVLPLEIVEAARVDGSGEFHTFNRIVLPMLKPALAVQLIFTFVTSWNNYFVPSLILTKAEYKTVPIMKRWGRPVRCPCGRRRAPA